MEELLKKLLLEKINDDEIDYFSKYLKSYNQPESNFNEEWKQLLLLSLLQTYNKYIGLPKLFYESEEIILPSSLINIDSHYMSEEQFSKELNKLSNINNKDGKNIKKILYQRFNRMIIGTTDLRNIESGWLKIYSRKLKVEGKKMSPQTAHRIYLSVDNSCLHKFAYLLLSHCQVFYLYDYEFKINDKNGKNFYDNVVIYATQEQLPKYIKIINKILEENPDITMNQPCLIAHKYDSNIVVAPYIDTESESYSDIVSEAISRLRDVAKTREEFIQMVEEYFKYTLLSTKKLCDDLKEELLLKKSVKGFL